MTSSNNYTNSEKAEQFIRKLQDLGFAPPVQEGQNPLRAKASSSRRSVKEKQQSPSLRPTGVDIKSVEWMFDIPEVSEILEHISLHFTRRNVLTEYELAKFEELQR